MSDCSQVRHTVHALLPQPGTALWLCCGVHIAVLSRCSQDITFQLQTVASSAAAMTVGVVAQEGPSALIAAGEAYGTDDADLDMAHLDKAVRLLDEGIRLKAPGDVVNSTSYNNRSLCQWRRMHCAQAVLDATMAIQLDYAHSWQPLVSHGRAWEMMGINSSAVKVCAHMCLRPRPGCTVQRMTAFVVLCVLLHDALQNTTLA